MDLSHLFDATAAVVVVGGTLVATALRCGLAEGRTTIEMLGQLARPAFRAEQARADLAGLVAQIRQDGVLRGRGRMVGDTELDEATDALIQTRSVGGLVERHEFHRRSRVARAETAVRTLSQGADLAPVFGLAGTLLSLSQLPAEGVARAALTGAISMAVLTTLYGLLLANLVFGPLARAVERQSRKEEEERQEVIDWLARQVAPACPSPEAHHRGRSHGAAPHAGHHHDPAVPVDPIVIAPLRPQQAGGDPVAPDPVAISDEAA
ncbi:MotA/TolQ/ExbB proton channel family protein [Novosphingobium sp. KCTC 2891]|uniref:MotA/TolQ/ExbB proton channel family protein n=1 Tax=Novosphingobium sp. KCTC 2891 TaxID=2989730 RepID=UPI0022222575|nr:MotA/TolQ/ExbB proton channel family protein [Novosphingobium sp. KCTC 2891]MCW1382989.1 MotA/TolQ/ExbB proton channel family protein [Novosphingobium sp. KCTC 2891]